MGKFTAAKFLILASNALFCMSIFCGCEQLSSTTQYYHPVGTGAYTAKAQSVPIDILYIEPKRPYKVIGRFAYSHSFIADNGDDYMDEVLKYNARKAGADAVFVIDKTVGRSAEKGEAPFEARGRQRGGAGRRGAADESPEEESGKFSTGSIGQNPVSQRVSIEAEMIVYGG